MVLLKGVQTYTIPFPIPLQFLFLAGIYISVQYGCTFIHLYISLPFHNHAEDYFPPYHDCFQRLCKIPHTTKIVSREGNEFPERRGREAGPRSNIEAIRRRRRHAHGR